MLTFFRRKNGAEQQAAEALYSAIRLQAREPVFYTDLGVPDSVDGRFDMVLLHGFVVLRRLGLLGRMGDSSAKGLAQAVYDVMFVDMDYAIREMGVGDLGVKKHIRRMMKAFNGRMAAYDSGLGDEAAQYDALRRNLYGTVEHDVPEGILKAMTVYLKQSIDRVDGQDMASLSTGKVMWGDLPAITTPEKRGFYES